MIFFPHLMMSRMLLSSSCVLVFLLCLSNECNGRHLSNIDDHHAKDDNPKLFTHSTIKGFENDPLIVHTDPNHITNENGKGQTAIPVHHDHDHNKQADCKSQNKKNMNKKDQKVKEELVHHHHRNPESLTTVTFRVPPKNKRVHRQPGFNLDYSPPKTHPPSHN